MNKNFYFVCESCGHKEYKTINANFTENSIAVECENCKKQWIVIRNKYDKNFKVGS